MENTTYQVIEIVQGGVSLVCEDADRVSLAHAEAFVALCLANGYSRSELRIRATGSV